MRILIVAAAALVGLHSPSPAADPAELLLEKLGRKAFEIGAKLSHGPEAGLVPSGTIAKPVFDMLSGIMGRRAANGWLVAIRERFPDGNYAGLSNSAMGVAASDEGRPGKRPAVTLSPGTANSPNDRIVMTFPDMNQDDCLVMLRSLMPEVNSGTVEVYLNGSRWAGPASKGLCRKRFGEIVRTFGHNTVTTIHP